MAKSGLIHSALALALLALTALAFLPSLDNGFSSLDDDTMVSGNKEITELSWSRAGYFFTHPTAYLYHPLVPLSYAVEYRSFGLDPRAYHATNLALHLLNVLLVYLLFMQLGADRLAAFVTALLFGVHPLHVESVAWISERKDVLYAFFYIGALLSYVRSVGCGGLRYLALSLFLFLCSLLSKPMAVSLPLVLCVIDCFMRRGWNRRVVLEKMPFFALAALLTAITVGVHYTDVAAELSFSPATKFVQAVYSVGFYAVKALCPAHLSVLYRYPWGPAGPAAPFVWGAAAACAAMTAVLLSLRRRRTVIFGVFFYLCTLLPVLHLFRVTASETPADRYTYIPLLGLFYIGAVGYARVIRLTRSAAGRTALCAAGLLAVALLISATRERCAVWRDGISLWTDAIRKDPLSVAAHRNRGNDYLEAKEHEKALADFSRVIELAPGDAQALFDRGRAYQAAGMHREAVADLSLAVTMITPAAQPQNYASLLNARGLSYASLRDAGGALRDFDEAIRVWPGDGRSYFSRGALLVSLGEYAKAESDLSAALMRADPSQKENYTAALKKRAFARFRMGRVQDALADYTIVLSMDPDDPVARKNLALCQSMVAGRSGGEAVPADERPAMSPAGR